MSFFDYMMQNHLCGEDRFADLARDMSNDVNFPHTDDYDEAYDYLVYDCGASSACVDVFKESWERYERTVHRV